ncbi:gamma carbonic anhydrase family protein [Terrihabitans sp. B22-R8]|uniref:gamma carbonic anhydrase family protein n=1 Tax=Terrihabitans sp. B22-R8 TaxID=3425128 RepID=UPI00403CADB4
MAYYALNGTAPKRHEAGVWIAPDAHVIGRVALGAESSVWFGAVIRGDNDEIVIGDATNIQDGAVLHVDPGFPLTIGENVTIGHRAIVHGCTIGAGSLVGMGATILNGASIGADSLVGANALVTEGKSFPERSLIVGAPAKAIRTLSDDEVAGLRKVAQHYVENGRKYREGLERLDGTPPPA